MATRQRKTPTKSLEEEAEEYTKKKRDIQLDKTLTLRRYYAGNALGGLLASGYNRPIEAVEEAFRYADLMLNQD